ncbi:MAG: PAS domain S-box protein [Burkholderiaceae bacterium]
MEDPSPAAGAALESERFRLLVDSVSDYAIYMLDPRGQVLTWNTGAERLKGYRPDEIVGRHFSRFYPPEAVERGLPAHELDMAARQGSFEDEGWRLRKDGSRFWASLVISAVRGPDGELLGFAKVTRDLTQRREQEEALRRSEERLRLLIEGVSDHALFMLDTNGHVVTWNVGAQRIMGYAAAEVVGAHHSVFYLTDARERGDPTRHLQEAARDGHCMDDGWRACHNGSTLWASVTITALHDASGGPVGFAVLTRDLTERRRAEALELATRHREDALRTERTARMTAQHTARIKDEFLATLSHELRTPLSAILGWTQVLLRPDTGLDAAALRRAIEVIDRNARAQVRLVDDMLDLSRIMTGKIRLDLHPTALQDLVQTIVDSAMPSAEAKGVRLRASLAAGTCVVNADGNRLQQVLWNLLTNAIKFTPGGGQIQVTLRVAGKGIELSVADTGIGIPASFLPQVFDRFSQQDGSASRAFGGLGLGLAICKQLVELHGGSISVSSPGEGQGATFVVRLPPSVEWRGDDEARHLRAPSRQPAAQAPQAPLPSLRGVWAFVIDDEQDARDLAQRLLEDQGAQVTSFADAEAALGALRESRPSVIVCDIGMPRMDGHQFMRAWRAGEPRGQRIPALALTAFARPEDRKACLLAGYQAHLAKPFDVACLVLQVAELAGLPSAER